MATAATLDYTTIKHPIDISSREFIEHKDVYYR